MKKIESGDFAIITAWVDREGQALEWTTDEGRTFQIVGDRRFRGMYERFFHENSHPTRQRIEADEVLVALQRVASTFELYRGQKGSGQFFNSFDALLRRAKEVLNVA